MNVLKEGQGFAQNTHGSHSVLGNSLEIVLPSFFFLKLGAINIHDMNIEKNAIKNGVSVLVYTSAGS